MTTVDQPSLSIEIADGVLAVTYAGHLDAAGGRLLLDAIEAACALDAPERVEIDLRHADGMTLEGAAALSACSRLGAHVLGGIHFRVGA